MGFLWIFLNLVEFGSILFFYLGMAARFCMVAPEIVFFCCFLRPFAFISLTKVGLYCRYSSRDAHKCQGIYSHSSHVCCGDFSAFLRIPTFIFVLLLTVISILSIRARRYSLSLSLSSRTVSLCYLSNVSVRSFNSICCLILFENTMKPAFPDLMIPFNQ